MANIENLRVPTSEEARRNGRKGGLASVAAKKKRKTLKEELLALLETGNTQKRVSVALIQKALEGDVRAFETIRDTIGEKPVDNVVQTSKVVDMSKFSTEEIKGMLDDDV